MLYENPFQSKNLQALRVTSVNAVSPKLALAFHMTSNSGNITEKNKSMKKPVIAVVCAIVAVKNC